ncbi:Hsp90 cochaperone [Mycoemilia scoparia]|uniref:Hsp90 cochaperone n=1 Tax=Mycoemilia scoparia TaxID=417184 RepID=A0A9W8DNB6_9FUNG|nr:Hsp90 cochaperone [Mycoemilia scoparia]
MSTADELKALGNKAFSSGQFSEAIEYFTKAIEQAPTNHVLYSNRSASHASLKNWQEALEDGIKTVELKPDWAKGYGRKGAALFGLGKLEEALDIFNEGLKLDPSNAQLKKGLQDVENALKRGPAGDDMFGEMAKVFSGDVLSKIAANPNLSKFLAEPDYVQRIQAIQKDPGSINAYLQDMRILQTMLSLSGIDAKVSDRAPPEASQTATADSMDVEEEVAAESKPKKSEPKKEDENKFSGLSEEERKNKMEALEEKTKGNAAYKKRDFDTALVHYNKAIELDPYDVTYYNNKAAVYFELGQYDECIEIEKKAIEIKYEHPTDYKLIGKAYGRIGSSYAKKNELASAIEYFNKSLTEHRSADILNKLRDTERLKKKLDDEAYWDDAKAEEARERGNALFKEGKFDVAVKEYTEAIKRNPKDPRNYSNRAACFTKLIAIPDAIKDCEKCLELDPTFIKAYLRRANIEFIKRNYADAIDFCETATEKDTEGKHKAEIEAQISNCYAAITRSNQGVTPQEALKRAEQNPEIQKVLSDPGMQIILQQMQTDPKAAREHMKNKEVARNLRKLWAAGIVRLG